MTRSRSFCCNRRRLRNPKSPNSSVRYRTITGICNNLRPGQATFGAGGIVTPRFFKSKMILFAFMTLIWHSLNNTFRCFSPLNSYLRSFLVWFLGYWNLYPNPYAFIFIWKNIMTFLYISFCSSYEITIVFPKFSYFHRCEVFWSRRFPRRKLFGHSPWAPFFTKKSFWLRF